MRGIAGSTSLSVTERIAESYGNSKTDHRPYRFNGGRD